ncbi:TetR/AcrR family transcriptional regulator [Promicromonospora sukumoe]|uniref:AcrR family transcriptional regulator n=1 Tax=Promicromonospora sukumoe TaxID=88382 RepID=A0A7W3PCG0_9MICO|nr:TetR family transcriptional regulator [Promicromonospora sukumoe]MBA8806606.1 AcrR family transcriptional regulator [Promicromonospora sukumoe]
MPRASAAAAAHTARQVLDSATDLFAARGFAAVSLDDVAQAAEVTRGAVYHHYGNKQGLFLAVAARLQSQVADAVVAAADGAGKDGAGADGAGKDGAGRDGAGKDAREQLRAGSHAFIDAITAGPALRVLLVDAPAVVGWAEWRRLDEANSAAHLREALREAGIANDLLDALTAQLSGAMNEAALWVAQQPDRAASARQAHAALDRLLTAALP